MPVGFVPASVTFVSLQTGWVLGTAPCATPPCTSLLRTTDGGRTWRGIPAPRAPLSDSDQDDAGAVSKVRFADAANGWVYGPSLWATHDGGATWAQPRLDGDGTRAAVADLEVAAGVVHAVVFDFGESSSVRIQTSRVATDAWRSSAISMSLGAGPVPQAELILQGVTGWMLMENRMVGDGARLEGGEWAPWTPACASGRGPGALAASSPTDLVAACNEGLFTEVSPVKRFYTSDDGGTAFKRTSGTPPCCHQLTSPVPGVAVADSDSNPGSLVATFDGGATWTTVYEQPGSASWTDLGFTSRDRGVAVTVEPRLTAGALVMTDDGGHTWRAVDFSS